MANIKLSDMYFDKIDAYNEFMVYGGEVCKQLFVEFANIPVEKILSGSIYYIYGLKGTGKTMLLKYAESKVLEDPILNVSTYIRFKRDVDAEQRNLIKRSGVPNNSFEKIIEKSIPHDNTIDCTRAWSVFLIKEIIRMSESREKGCFVIDDNYNKLVKLFSYVYGQEEENSIIKILPKLKQGCIELSIPNIAKASFEFEWEDKEKTKVSFFEISKKIISLYSQLKFAEGAEYVFIDELELSLKKGKDYDRDVTLIRDLVLAVEKINEINREKNYNVFIIAAIRTEVYKHVAAKGFELNKTLNDFGVELTWKQRGQNIKNNPLIKMIEKRIQFSEEKILGKSSGDVWKKYFPEKTADNKDIIKYILNQTWDKPRDVIRFFSIIKAENGENEFFDLYVFDNAKKKYSDESWQEFVEALIYKYSDKEIEGIKQGLTGLTVPFDPADFSRNLLSKKEYYPSVSELTKKHRIPEILKDLYEMGIIGNYYEQSRFVFKGFDYFDPNLPITIHYPLWKYFSIKTRQKNIEDTVDN